MNSCIKLGQINRTLIYKYLIAAKTYKSAKEITAGVNMHPSMVAVHLDNLTRQNLITEKTIVKNLGGVDRKVRQNLRFLII